MFPVLACALAAWLPACGGGDDDDGGSSEAGSSGDDGSGGTGGSGGGRGGAGGTGGSSSGRGGGSSGGTTSGGTGGTSQAGASGEGGGSNTDGLAYPLTLSSIGTPNVSTAHVSLYFTVTDANGEPVSGLATGSDGDLGDFVAREDGTELDPFESAFRVSHPTAALVIPTVLLLDLSRSVVEAGALDELKDAAKAIIDSLAPAQRLAIVTFASEATTRQTFTTDKELLRDAVDAIDDADGIATNLYGALQTGYAMWDDGFRIYDPDATEPQLVSGLMIAVSDGNDTAGVSTLSQVLATRGTKRTLFIRVGDDLDRTVADQIANAGLIDAEGGFDELDAAVDATTDRISELNGAIYAAEYCSPKRAGQHELLFTVEGNEEYLNGGGGSEAMCLPTGAGPSCSGETSMYCGSDPSGVNDYVCCAPTHPYLCINTQQCYRSAEDAYEDCGVSCRACSTEEEVPGGSGAAGPALEISFTASAFNDAQCEALFEDPNDGSGGAGGGSGEGGAGNGGPTGSACSNLHAAANAFGDSNNCPARFVNCVLEEDLTLACSSPAECQSERDALRQCLANDIEANPGTWKCTGEALDCAGAPCAGQIQAYVAACGL